MFPLSICQSVPQKGLGCVTPTGLSWDESRNLGKAFLTRGSVKPQVNMGHVRAARGGAEREVHSSARGKER